MKRAGLILALAGAALLLNSCGTAKSILGVPMRILEAGKRTVTQHQDGQSPAASEGVTAALATRIYGG